MSVTVFLDKDGTLIDDVPYNVNPEHIRLAEDAPAALEEFARAGCALVVVTNQSGVARGYFPESAIEGVRHRLGELVAEQGVNLTGFYYCPHPPDGGCDCRKPADGLIRRAAEELDVDLTRAWMVGDILDDIEAGTRAGCRTILVDRGHETEWRLGAERIPSGIARDLYTAARMIARCTAPGAAGRRAS